MCCTQVPTYTVFPFACIRMNAQVSKATILHYHDKAAVKAEWLKHWTRGSPANYVFPHPSLTLNAHDDGIRVGHVLTT